MTDRAKELINLFQLSKHPEGGYFREVYRSEIKVKTEPSGVKRSGLTDIYFLITENNISRFHRLAHDEIWHFYEGAPITIIDIHPESLNMNRTTLGSPDPLLVYKHCIKGTHWQCAFSNGPYSFVGCTVGPGFEFDDFEMMAHQQQTMTAVLSKYPDVKKYM